MSITRETLLATKGYRSVTVEVKELGAVTLRTLGLKDRVELEKVWGDVTEGSSVGVVVDAMTHVLVKVIIDPETGERILEDGDEKSLESHDGQIIEALFKAWMKVTKDYQDELVGNSESDQPTPSPTDSP